MGLLKVHIYGASDDGVDPSQSKAYPSLDSGTKYKKGKVQVQKKDRRKNGTLNITLDAWVELFNEKGGLLQT